MSEKHEPLGPDPEVAELLRTYLSAPPLRPGFHEQLEARLGKHGTTPRANSRWRGFVSQRKRGLLAAAVLAAALVGIVMLTGVPGMRETQPASATAAERLVAAIDAGLAKIQTVRGVIVFDSPASDKLSQPARASFAATSKGDRLVDVRYRTDWARAGTAYRDQLAQLQRDKSSISQAEYSRWLKEISEQARVVTRTVWVTKSADHASILAFFSSDPVTRRLARARYLELGWDLGLHRIPGSGESQRIWGLATQLRSELAGQSEISIADTTFDGRPASRVVVPSADGNPGWEAIVDKEYGITLAVRLQRGQPSAGGDDDAYAFHVERLRVNEPLADDTFAVHPDYRPAAAAGASSRQAPEVRVDDVTEGSPATRFYSPDQLQDVVSPRDLVSQSLPAGYRLSEIARTGDANAPLTLVYRRGLNTCIVRSLARSALSAGRTGSGLGPVDRSSWPELSFSGDEFTRIEGGTLNGAAAMLFAGVGGAASLTAWTDSTKRWSAVTCRARNSSGLRVRCNPSRATPGAHPEPIS